MNRTRLAQTTAAFVAAATLAPAPAHADLALGPVQDIGAAGKANVAPSVAAGPTGALRVMSLQAQAKWANSNLAFTGPKLVQRSRPAGGAFTAKEAQVAAPADVGWATTADNPAGDTFTAWTGHLEPTVSLVFANGSGLVSGTGGKVRNAPAVALAEDGGAVAVWPTLHTTGTYNRLSFVRRFADGTFAQPDTYALPAVASDVAVDVNAQGRWAVSWSEGGQVKLATSQDDGSLGPATTVAGVKAAKTALRIDGQGTAVLFGQSATGSNLLVASKPYGGSLSTPQVVAEPALGGSNDLQAVRDGQGGVVAAWNPSYSTTPARIVRWTPGAGLGATETVAGPAGVTSDIDVSARGGAVAVAWTDLDPDSAAKFRGRVWAAHRNPGEPFGPARLVQDKLYSPTVSTALDGRGQGAVTWQAPQSDYQELPDNAAWVVDLRLAEFTAVALPQPAAASQGPAPQASAPGRGSGTAAPVRDRLAPALSGLRVKTSRKARTAAFRLSERARVTVRVERRIGKRWKRAATLRPTTLAAGRRSLSLRRKLRPGRYRLVAQATDRAGNRSRAAQVAFRVR